MVLAQKISSHAQKKMYLQFYDFCGYKNWLDKKMFSPSFFPPFLVLLLDPGSEIRDPVLIKIRIRDKHPGSATLNKREEADRWHNALVISYQY